MLNSEQIKAINHFKGPGLVLAGPGSGKTTVIANRVKWLVEEKCINPNSILVLTFTKSAAINMKKRYVEMVENKNALVHFSTFHSLFYSIISEDKSHTRKGVISESDKINIIKEVVIRLKLNVSMLDDFALGLVAEISRYKGKLNKEEFETKYTSIDNFRKILEGYNRELEALNKMDFDDIQSICKEKLDKDESLRLRLREKFSFVLIDEFQDINDIQYYIIESLLSLERNIFVVGDDDQSIYGFRGARPELMLNFPHKFKDTKVYHLLANYRCAPQVIDISKKLIANNEDRFDKEIYSGLNGFSGRVNMRLFCDFKDQMECVIRNIRSHLKEGLNLRNMAILVRDNSQIYGIEQILNNKGIKTKYNKKAKVVLHDYILDILAYLSAPDFIGDITKNEALLRVINKPHRFISREIIAKCNSIEDIKKYYPLDSDCHKNINDLIFSLNMIKKLKPDAAIMFIRKAVGYEDYLRDVCNDSGLDFKECIRQIDSLEYKAKNYKSRVDFIKAMADNKRTDDAKDMINIITMHASKGLEFDVVFIVNVNEDIIPSKQSAREGNIEEERRLLYVAMTRAKGFLYIYYIRRDGAKLINPSIFLKELDENIY